MSGRFRLDGGAIDRGRSLAFRFDGRRLTGHPGDTLASALLANGVRLVGRSFKYHRPRGLFTAGSEEPNALVELRGGAHREPNTRATVAELFDGLEAASQNYRGSLRRDLLAVNDLLAPFLSAGFYYKTFMWPKTFWERVYEPAIQASAGLGRLSGEADPDSYDKGFLHCDLLVIGAGPAGLAAALAAGRSGARVILADEDFVMGGRLNAETHEVDHRPGAAWAADAVDELASMVRVRPMPRTTVVGAYDHGIYSALERRTDHLAAGNGKPRQILWRIYSKRAILCAGATERPIAFGGNDRPGIMLAGAVRAYANRFAVAAGRRVGLFTNNDDGWRTAADLARKGVSVAAVIDVRDREPVVEVPGARMPMGGRVTATRGRHGLKGITLATGERIALDCLAVSGGWNPNVHLTCHHGGKPVWRNEIAAFVPGDRLPGGMTVAGAAGGAFTTAAALAEGHGAAVVALGELGRPAAAGDAPSAGDEATDLAPFWHVRESRGRAWLDLQNDVTVKDVVQSHREGFRSVELMKRYTTLGMATDQGKTANVSALAILAEETGSSIAETGTTVFRPPYTPVPVGAFAGRSRGREFRPTRLTPSHGWAERHGAVFIEAGMWLRAQWFPRAGETRWRQSVDREVTQTRGSVGICDVTTLGKIDIQGRDAAEFLNRLYANGSARLAVGKVRYGLMLREDGMAYDDGTTARLGETRFVMTTTTANAVPVFRNMEFARQCLWPGLDVHLISATEQWAQFAVAGPNSRRLLQQDRRSRTRHLQRGLPLHGLRRDRRVRRYPGAAVPHLVFGRAGLRDRRAGTLRRSPDGSADGGRRGIRRGRLRHRGARRHAGREGPCGGPGTDRPDHGADARHAAHGVEEEGLHRQYPVRTAGDEPGRRAGDDGLPAGRPVAGTVPAGAHFLAPGAEATVANDEGWMTSVAYSPMLETSIGLGFIRRGHARIGETVRAWDGVRGTDIAGRDRLAAFLRSGRGAAPCLTRRSRPARRSAATTGRSARSRSPRKPAWRWCRRPSRGAGMPPSPRRSPTGSAPRGRRTGDSAEGDRHGARVLGMQPDQLFILFEPPDRDRPAETVSAALGAAAYVTDQSDSWAMLRIAGAGVRIALERICPLDLDGVGLPGRPGGAHRDGASRGGCPARRRGQLPADEPPLLRPLLPARGRNVGRECVGIVADASRWLGSCRRISSKPASVRTCDQNAWSHISGARRPSRGKTDRAERGRRSRTSRAASHSQTVRGPVQSLSVLDGTAAAWRPSTRRFAPTRDEGDFSGRPQPIPHPK